MVTKNHIHDAAQQFKPPPWSSLSFSPELVIRASRIDAGSENRESCNGDEIPELRLSNS